MPLLNFSISQVLWFVVATNLLKKIKGSILFLKWLTSGGLVCYRVPENADLEKLRDKNSGHAKRSQAKQAKTRKSNHNKTSESNSHDYKIKSADLAKLNLSTVEVTPWNLQFTAYGDELEWVIDFACMSIISFLITELIIYYTNKTGECNYSILWIVLVILQCLFTLLELTSIYFRNQESIGERSICIVSGCVFLLLAMLVMTFDDTRLDLGVNKSFSIWNDGLAINSSSEPLLGPDEIDLPSEQPASVGNSSIVGKLFIAVVSSLVGIIFTFPGFRFGQLHERHLAKSELNLGQKLLYNLNYLSPLIVVCLWIPAVSRDVLRRQNYMEIDDNKFELIRICIAILLNVLRLVLVRTYIATFLASGADRLDRLRHKAGTTTSREVRLLIAGMNNYVNVVSLQYILPTLICLFTSIMYLAFHQATKSANIIYDGSDIRDLFGDKPFVDSIERVLDPMWNFFNSHIPKNLSSFATWWFHFVWLCTSTLGVVYHKYFTL